MEEVVEHMTMLERGNPIENEFVEEIVVYFQRLIIKV